MMIICLLFKIVKKCQKVAAQADIPGAKEKRLQLGKSSCIAA